MNISFIAVDLYSEDDKLLIKIFLGDTMSIIARDLSDEEINGYYLGIHNRQKKDPLCCTFAKIDDEVIGLVDTSVRINDVEKLGFVYFIYLAQKYRGMKLGPLLEQRAVHVLTSQGCSILELDVSKKNERAIKFYLKQGWIRTAENNDFLKMRKNLSKN